ncbi:hypothetical protein ACFOON_17245 [Novosphingobium piscinae]|uniref:Uncharacterized protein n=1 Tax=Novosphingobium piscinae TaxID=1507448 RepID=A0A7X1G0I9_9SPHN|nr:hypothetical protein [Novosphingobium piscinae]MBC2670321.1 hypothetical protein [Novosphingobium piscinae]
MACRIAPALAMAGLLIGSASPLPASAGTSALVGHYYLSGVRETGSELVLGADGRFAWFLSYGALDQTAEGTWRREGDAVILAADPPDRSKPLFAALDREDWSVEAEQAVLDLQADAAAAAALARCPFLAAGDVAMASAAPMLVTPADPPPSVAALRARALAARQQAETLRRAAEAAAREAVGDAAHPPAPEQVESARAALAAWREAQGAAQDAARSAGAAASDLPEAALPAPCLAAPPARADTLPPERWIGGLAVRVVEPNYRQGIGGVIVTVSFANGQAERLETGRRGLAIRPGPAPAALTAVTLDLPAAPGRAQRFAVAPLPRGVLHFAIDGRQLIEPPFATLRLRIDGAALVPDSLGRGRYERGR